MTRYLKPDFGEKIQRLCRFLNLEIPPHTHGLILSELTEIIMSLLPINSMFSHSCRVVFSSLKQMIDLDLKYGFKNIYLEMEYLTYNQS